MRTRRVIEAAVGLGLLLGPLVYALSLDGAPTPECEAAEPAPVVVQSSDAGGCDQPVTPRVEPEPKPEPEVVEVVRSEPESVPSPSARIEFAFVDDAGLVLSTDAEHDWGTGRLFMPASEARYIAAKRADASKIPDELWSQRGRSFDLYGPDGKVCTARLGELRVVAQYGGWGLAGVLGEDWYDEDPELAKRSEVLAGLWARDDLRLVAELESPESCAGALWARDAELPPPTILRHSFAPNPISDARLAEFLGSDELAQTEETYRAEYAARVAELPEDVDNYYETWDEVVAEHGATVWSWVDDRARPRLVGLEFGREPEVCGDYLESYITSLDYVRGDQLVAVGHGHAPEAIFDADGDGQWELLYEQDYGYTVELISATLEQSLVLDRDWACPC